MQRQSLGSPVTKLQSHGLLSKEDDLAEEQQKRKVSMVTDEEDNKIDKLKRSPPKPEKLIHLIPILTMLCFLVLYLCSHDPSQKGKKPELKLRHHYSRVDTMMLTVSLCFFFLQI